MSGGIAYVCDESGMFDTRCNLDMVDLESVWHQKGREVLYRLISKHYSYRNSPRAKTLLDNWEAHLPLFVKVMPIDYRQVLERKLIRETTDQTTISATEVVYIR